MNKPYMIGITGGSGSGKTSFIHELRKLFKEEDLCVISQDDYYRPRTEQELDEQGVVNFDLPKSIYKKEFQNDIERLLAGEIVTREEYTFNNKNVKPKILTFHPRPIIVVEGLFIFHYKKIRKLLDLKVFIHAKENLKVIRRIQRDGVERNYPLDDVLYRYQHHVLPNFEKYILPYKDRADLVINNNDNFDNGLQVLSGFIKQKLQSLSAGT
jgi:Uridine kinase